MSEKLPYPTPGEILKEILEEMKISQARLSRRAGIPARRVSQIINGKRPITAEDSLRLGYLFGQSDPFWLNMQHAYDLRQAREKMGSQIEKEIQPLNIESQG